MSNPTPPMRQTAPGRLPILDSRRFWYCPRCGKEDVSSGTERRPHARFHVCPKLHYLTAPMLPKGMPGKLEVNEREDYIGKEKVQLDPERGRPVMNIVTTRDSGQDCTVFAPTATARLGE